MDSPVENFCGVKSYPSFIILLFRERAEGLLFVIA